MQRLHARAHDHEAERYRAEFEAAAKIQAVARGRALRRANGSEGATGRQVCGARPSVRPSERVVDTEEEEMAVQAVRRGLS